MKYSFERICQLLKLSIFDFNKFRPDLKSRAEVAEKFRIFQFSETNILTCVNN